MFDLKKQEHSNLLQQANNISNKKYETSSANNTNGKHQSNNDLIHRQKSTSSTSSSMSSAANQLNSKNNNNHLKNNLKHKHKTNSKQSKQAKLLHNNNTNSNSSFGYEDDLDETNTTVTTVTTNQINNDTDLNSNSKLNTNNEDYEDHLNYSDTTTTNNQSDQPVCKKDEINDTSPTKKIRVNHEPVTSSPNLNKQSNSIYTPPKQTPQSQVFNSAASIIAETEAAAHRAALATLTNNFSMPPYIPPLNNQNQITNQPIQQQQQQQPHPVNFNIDSFNSFMLANLNNSKLSMPPPGPSTSNLMQTNDQSQQQFIKLMVSVANCRKFILFLVLSKSNFYKKTSKPLFLKIIPKLFILFYQTDIFVFYLYISYFIV